VQTDKREGGTGVYRGTGTDPSSRFRVSKCSAVQEPECGAERSGGRRGGAQHGRGRLSSQYPPPRGRLDLESLAGRSECRVVVADEVAVQVLGGLPCGITGCSEDAVLGAATTGAVVEDLAYSVVAIW
jgi:hypothetical protein